MPDRAPWTRWLALSAAVAAADLATKRWVSPPLQAGTRSVGVQWCTIPDSTDTTRFRLFRFLGVGAANCDGGSSSTFQTDYLRVPASGWPSNATVSPAPADWDGNLWPDRDRRILFLRYADAVPYGF